MALRSSWEGFIRLSLISIPVRAYNAVAPGGGDIHFHQIHRECGNRIRYQKVCPIHGEVSKDEIASGYEYEKGKYLELDPEELRKVRAEDDESITIDAFTAPDEVDAMYLSGKTFFLVPAGPAGQKPYVLLHKIMLDQQRHAVASVILSGHDETVLLRPIDKLITMSVLYYEKQMKQPSAFADEVGEPKLTAQELKLGASLVEASTPEKFDFSHYKDRYTERVSDLIEMKMAGKKIEAPPSEKAPHVLNLMDALRKSLDKTHAAKPKHEHRAAGRHEKSHRRRKTA
jgi:DNA end-binding protein Ku